MNCNQFKLGSSTNIRPIKHPVNYFIRQISGNRTLFFNKGAWLLRNKRLKFYVSVSNRIQFELRQLAISGQVEVKTKPRTKALDLRNAPSGEIFSGSSRFFGSVNNKARVMEQESDYKNPQSLKRLALHYASKSNQEKAREYAEQYRKYNPDDPEINSILKNEKSSKLSPADEYFRFAEKTAGDSKEDFRDKNDRQECLSYLDDGGKQYLSRQSLQDAPNHLPHSDIASYSRSDRHYKVLFYIYKNVHAPMLLPVYDAMKERSEFEIAFCTEETLENRAFSRFTPNELDELHKLPVQFTASPREWSPDVTLVADNVAYMLEGCGKIVNIGHGLLSKGQYFTDSSYTARENLEDLLCVPGSYHKQQLEASGKVFIPIVATGYPKLDVLFRSDTLGRDDLMRQAGLDPQKKVVLYAPTFNIALSSMPILWMRVRHIADENTCLLIKLHGSTMVQFKEHYLSLAEKHENIHYIADMNLAPYMKIADVMVSDVSSAFMEFICLDRPVVLFNNPNREDYINYDPRDIEYQWRDVGIQANTLEELLDGVHRSLDNPQEFSEKRRRYAGQLLAAQDGKSAHRVVEAVLDLMENRLHSPLDDEPPTGVIIPVAEKQTEKLMRTLEAIFNDGGEKVEVIIHGRIAVPLQNELSRLWNGKVKFFDRSSEIQSLINSYKYITLVKPGIVAGEKWLFRLINHLRQDTTIEGVIPMGLGGTDAQNPLKYLKFPDTRPLDAASLDGKFRYMGVGRRLKSISETPLSDLWAVRTTSPSCQALFVNGENRIEMPCTRLEKTAMAMDLVIQ